MRLFRRRPQQCESVDGDAKRSFTSCRVSHGAERSSGGADRGSISVSCLALPRAVVRSAAECESVDGDAKRSFTSCRVSHGAERSSGGADRGSISVSCLALPRAVVRSAADVGRHFMWQLADEPCSSGSRRRRPRRSYSLCLLPRTARRATERSCSCALRSRLLWGVHPAAPRHVHDEAEAKDDHAEHSRHRKALQRLLQLEIVLQ